MRARVVRWSVCSCGRSCEYSRVLTSQASSAHGIKPTLSLIACCVTVRVCPLRRSCSNSEVCSRGAVPKNGRRRAVLRGSISTSRVHQSRVWRAGLPRSRSACRLLHRAPHSGDVRACRTSSKKRSAEARLKAHGSADNLLLLSRLLFWAVPDQPGWSGMMRTSSS